MRDVFKKKDYSFRFENGTITVSAFNEKEAKILAKAEAIKRGWRYGLLKPSVIHLDCLIDLSNLTADEEVRFRDLLAQARQGDMYEEE